MQLICSIPHFTYAQYDNLKPHIRDALPLPLLNNSITALNEYLSETSELNVIYWILIISFIQNRRN